jgi:hypothetical protein
VADFVERHYMYDGTTWKESPETEVPDDKNIRWIATVRVHRDRILVLLNTRRVSKAGRKQKWVDAEKYKQRWMTLALKPGRSVTLTSIEFPDEEVSTRGAGKERPEQVKEQVQLCVTDGVLGIEGVSPAAPAADGASAGGKRRKLTLFANFRLPEEFTDCDHRMVFMRANTRMKGSEREVFDMLLRGPVSALLRTPFGAPTTVAATAPLAEPDVPRPAPRWTARGLGRLVSGAVRAARTRAVRAAVKWPMSTAAVLTSLLYIGGLGWFGLRVLSDSPGRPVQYLAFVAVVSSFWPVIALERRFTALGREEAAADQLDDDQMNLVLKEFGTPIEHFQQAQMFFRVLISSIFVFVMYISVSAVAWPAMDENDPAYHWLWSDRQTLGLLATIFITVVSTIFNNALRDLSNQNTSTRREASLALEKSRVLMNELHELSHRFWSEFETHFKDEGKLFLFRANEFAFFDRVNLAERPVAPVLKGLQFLANKVDASDSTSSEEAGSAGSVMSGGYNEESARVAYDYLDSQFPGLQWEDDPEYCPDPSRPGEMARWIDSFQATDFGPAAVPNLNFDRIFRIKSACFAMTRSAQNGTGSSANAQLVDVVRHLVSEDDGRFFVPVRMTANTQERLMLQRRINAVVRSLDVVGGTKNMTGYFPTDESLTISLIEEMLAAEDWPEGEGLAEWLAEVYDNVQAFGLENKARFERMEALISELETLLGGQGMPTNLFLDDLQLFGEILRTGTDPLHAPGSELTPRQLTTTARVLTYAAAYYVVQVWHRGLDRRLPPTFPSPFARLESAEVIVKKHESDYFENLRRKVNDEISGVDGDIREDHPLWPAILELSNRQSPTTNFLRAARAFVTRRAFLTSRAGQPSLLEGWSRRHVRQNLLRLLPGTRVLLMNALFGVNQPGSRRWWTLLRPESHSHVHIDDETMAVSVKVSRKSSVRSFAVREGD